MHCTLQGLCYVPTVRFPWVVLFFPASSLRVLLDLSLKIQQLLHNLPPHELGQSQTVILSAFQLLSNHRHSPGHSHSLPCDDAICSAILPTAIAPSKPSIPIYLYAPKDILRPGNAPIVWWVSQVANMDPSAMARAAHAALVVRAACTIVRLRKIGSTRRCIDGRLRLHIRIVNRVRCKHRGQDRQKLRVFGKVLGRGRQRAACANG